MKFPCFFIIFITVITYSTSQIKARPVTNYEHSFDYSHKKLYKDIHDLAFRITSKESSQERKVKAIYLWLVKNIAYDYELRSNSVLQKQFYTSEENVVRKVLERKKALCGGVSFLFERLCFEIGVEAETVHGYTDTTKDFSKPSHSWNVVRLYNKWNILDITWSQNSNNLNQPDLYWYKTEPKEFVKTHYPLDIKWTLLSNPPKIDEFIMRLP
jgi:transglutaminase/protease-like cytokinesis protein 3